MTTLDITNSLSRQLHGQHWTSVRAYKRARQDLLDELEPSRSLQAAVKGQDNTFYVTKLKTRLKDERWIRLDGKLADLANNHPYRWLAYAMLAVIVGATIVVIINHTLGY
ncbi:hypothetical protein IT415_03580 [bacterium]|nr:hypothetical protein [bacterium]